MPEQEIWFVGYDKDGDKVYKCIMGKHEFLYPVTRCCNADGKGWETPTGVCCRKCYRTVDSKFGGSAEIAEALDEPILIKGI